MSRISRSGRRQGSRTPLLTRERGRATELPPALIDPRRRELGKEHGRNACPLASLEPGKQRWGGRPFRLAGIQSQSRVDPAGRDGLVSTGRTFVVVDALGAGEGEMVLIVQGSSARLTPETEKLPIDACIIGIVDTVNVENQMAEIARDLA